MQNIKKEGWNGKRRRVFQDVINILTVWPGAKLMEDSDMLTPSWRPQRSLSHTQGKRMRLSWFFLFVCFFKEVCVKSKKGKGLPLFWTFYFWSFKIILTTEGHIFILIIWGPVGMSQAGDTGGRHSSITTTQTELIPTAHAVIPLAIPATKRETPAGCRVNSWISNRDPEVLYINICLIY